MSKIALIPSCALCPHSEVDDGKGYCGHPKAPNKELNWEELIPEWCTLEDDDDLRHQLAEAEGRAARLWEVMRRIKKGIERWKAHGEDYSLLQVVVSTILEMADKALEAAEAGE